MTISIKKSCESTKRRTIGRASGGRQLQATSIQLSFQELEFLDPGIAMDLSADRRTVRVHQRFSHRQDLSFSFETAERITSAAVFSSIVVMTDDLTNLNI
jgi:hypothetical protein